MIAIAFLGFTEFRPGSWPGRSRFKSSVDPFLWHSHWQYGYWVYNFYKVHWRKMHMSLFYFWLDKTTTWGTLSHNRLLYHLGILHQNAYGFQKIDHHGSTNRNSGQSEPSINLKTDLSSNPVKKYSSNFNLFQLRNHKFCVEHRKGNFFARNNKIDNFDFNSSCFKLNKLNLIILIFRCLLLLSSIDSRLRKSEITSACESRIWLAV